jgi:NAD+ synthase (glutamine-hydrolysing)
MAPRSLRLAILQLNSTVGDLTANSAAILKMLRLAEGAGADLAVTPELSLTGYPPEDLLLRPQFIRSAKDQLRRLASQTRSTALVCGYPEAADHPAVLRGKTYNAAAVLHQKHLAANYRKMALPNYGVFDEQRYFTPGSHPLALDLRGKNGSQARVAVSICEDLWPDGGGIFFKALTKSRPDILINLSASPFARGKMAERLKAMKAAVRITGAHIVYVNLIGGQDELVFDGRSFVMAPDGKLIGRAAAFAEDMLCVDIPLRGNGTRRHTSASTIHKTLQLTKISNSSTAKNTPPPTQWPAAGSDEEVLAGIELSLRDYVQKNRFASVGVAMSGGIDSALVAAIAVRALGPQKVIGVTLPSNITSKATLADAVAQSKTMGIQFFNIPIRSIMSSFLTVLQPSTRDGSGGAMEENLQARVRGTVMMALSNRMGFLLLATGNKSELATGYCTLYGDMAGGFAPIKDLTKGWVYRLAKCINRLESRPWIPVSVIRRAPTAELKPGQKDQDTLPPYPILDDILEQYVERDIPAQPLIRSGHKSTHVLDTARRVLLNEYKRRQAPIGPKISQKAFGRDRRMPITQRAGEQY